MSHDSLKIIEPSTFEKPACARENPIYFYVDDDDEVDLPAELSNKSYDKAVEICKECFHKVDCAEWGIRYEKWGVWGGLTPLERIRVRRKRGIRVSDSK